MKTEPDVSSAAVLASLLALAAPQSTAADLQGSLTSARISPTTIEAGQPVTVTVMGKIKAGGKGCEIMAGLVPSQSTSTENAVRKIGTISSFPGTPTQTVTIVNKPPGDYELWVYPAADNPALACDGKVKVAIKVIAPAALTPKVGNPTTPSSLACPTGYDASELNPNSGSIRCTKHAAVCPQGYNGSQDATTGKLECTPNRPATLDCPKTTNDSQWGASYYKEGWRYLGCAPNQAPPR